MELQNVVLDQLSCNLGHVCHGMHNAMLVNTKDQHPCCMHILKIWSRHCAFPYLHVFWDAHKARNRGEKMLDH